LQGEKNRNRFSSKKTAPITFIRSQVTIIESNVDDVAGEILARACERILDNGAFDCTLVPFTGKKGRPGITIRVVARRNLVSRLSTILVQETGTLGLKIFGAERWSVQRRTEKIKMNINGIRRIFTVKIAGSRKVPIRVKPEMDEVRSISKETGITVREIERRVTNEAIRTFFRTE
jgi:pyridinium-3,5-bisthiocarboxylic acid mononucleotide nickel chelatase